MEGREGKDNLIKDPLFREREREEENRHVISEKTELRENYENPVKKTNKSINDVTQFITTFLTPPPSSSF